MVDQQARRYDEDIAILDRSIARLKVVEGEIAALYDRAEAAEATVALLRGALEELVAVVNLFGVQLLPEGGYACFACGLPSTSRETLAHHGWCAAKEALARAALGEPSPAPLPGSENTREL